MSVTLNPDLDVVDLTAALVDIESVSHNEGPIADACEVRLRATTGLTVHRLGNTLVARTGLGRPERVLIAGHLDTVPVADNLPSRFEVVEGEERLYGVGACDMKGGTAVGLYLATTIGATNRDITYVLYEAEEVDSQYNGLGLVAAAHPEWLKADFAVVTEPSNATIEAGCQGTLRADVRTHGRRSHSARSWVGHNAIHDLAAALERLTNYVPRQPVIDGLTYHEGLNAVLIRGGVAANVIPDEAVLTVNHRFAPDRSAEGAIAHVREVFDGYDIEIVDVVAGAMPGLSHPTAAAFVAAVGATPNPKFGWTDVARLSALGVPAVNFGPGDPLLAHTREEYTPTEQIRSVERALRIWLTT